MGRDRISRGDSSDEDTEDFKTFIQQLKDQQETFRRELPVDRSKTIWLPSDEPVAVCFSADWHLGSLGVDYDRFATDIDFLIKHKEVRLVTVGDLSDNFRTFKSLQPIFEQGLSPYMQGRMLLRLAKALSEGNRYLAATWGNHDVERDERLFAESPVAAMLREHTVFFDGVGMLTLKIGLNEKTAQPYTVLMTHNARGSSRTDKNYSGKRLYTERFPADVIVTAHRHAPSISQDTWYESARDAGMPFGGQRIQIACGTYKAEDGLARRYYPTEGQVGAPTVLFWPKEHRMEVFRSAESAVVFLRGLREYGRSHR